MLDLKNVPKELQYAIRERGYGKLTSVQSLVLDPSNNGKDLLVSSQTGSAKHSHMVCQYHVMVLKKS